MSERYAIRELRLRNFRAFRDARVTFEPDLTLLLGQNGAGKSTILDAFEVLRDLFQHGLTVSLERRGGLAKVRSSLAGASDRVGLAAVIDLGGESVLYGVEFGEMKKGPVIVSETVVGRGGLSKFGFVRTADGVSALGQRVELEPSTDSSVLPVLGGVHVAYGVIRNVLRSVEPYRLETQALRAETRVGSSTELWSNGSNLGDVIAGLSDEDRVYVSSRLANIAPGIASVKTEVVAGRRVLRVRQRLAGKKAHILDGSQLSDGTIRALAILVALRQRESGGIVLIDEFEDSIHPAEVEGLLDAAWTTARQRTPVAITTHSPELLDHDEIEGRNVRLIRWEGGESHVHRLAENTARLIDGRKESAGSLLRANVLNGLGTPERGPADLCELP